MASHYGYFVDLHCHPTMRLYHSPAPAELKDYWRSIPNQSIDSGLARWVEKMSKGVAKVSQASFDHCVRGRVRVVFDSLYPMERGFVRFRKVPELLIPEHVLETLVVTASGVSSERFHHGRKSDDYYSELHTQYKQLVDNQGPSACGRFGYKVVNNIEEMQAYLDEDFRHVAVIVTIEGAHVFGCGTPTDEATPEDVLTERLLARVEEVKAWEHPPFFITFAHHFWNQLCGHAATLPAATRLTCDQTKGLNEGFTTMGWAVLKALLSKENGKRILIDTRHMSAQARREYYAYLQAHNRENPDDLIPIISSHSGTNGFATLDESDQTPDEMAKTKEGPFCGWSLNISDEEMRIIHESKGIIGVMADKGRLSGTDLLHEIDSIKSPALKKLAFLKLFLDNMFALVAAVGDVSAWDVLTLGTDFDGVITHIDTYPNLSATPQFQRDLITYMRNTGHKRHLWFGLTPAEICEKVFTTNAVAFLERNFR